MSSSAAQWLERVSAILEPVLAEARVPGAAVGVIANGEVLLARGYGYRDRDAKLPMTARTAYPIGSTTKAFNATLLAMLVGEGKLDWDVPVRAYLPRFRLRAPFISSQITLRDLVAMRTGLPRHDWMWIDQSISREELIERLCHLDLSAGLRERFQYNNLTTITAGYIAELVSGETWEELIRGRILAPLGMSSTGFAPPVTGTATLSYHENLATELVPTVRFAAGVAAPAGGVMHSTVEDMMRWLAFNLTGRTADGAPLIHRDLLKELHSPWMLVGAAPEAISPHCGYGGGWFVDTYNGRPRVSHGGYLYDVTSDVALFPADRIAVVSFNNFGWPRLPRFINEHLFDLLQGLDSPQTFAERLGQIEKKRAEHRDNKAAAIRVPGTVPSHAASDYAGTYAHPGYGLLDIEARGQELFLRRGQLTLPLEHWHYDAWCAREGDRLSPHEPHPFDCLSRLQFDTGPDGSIAGVTIRLEPAVAPLRFERRTRGVER